MVIGVATETGEISHRSSKVAIVSEYPIKAKTKIKPNWAVATLAIFVPTKVIPNIRSLESVSVLIILARSFPSSDFLSINALSTETNAVSDPE